MRMGERTCCPYCEDPRSRVVKVITQPTTDPQTHVVHRRRRCPNGHRYTTESTERVIGRYSSFTVQVRAIYSPVPTT